MPSRTSSLTSSSSKRIQTLSEHEAAGILHKLTKTTQRFLETDVTASLDAPWPFFLPNLA
jgi:hypothetical protein